MKLQECDTFWNMTSQVLVAPWNFIETVVKENLDLKLDFIIEPTLLRKIKTNLYILNEFNIGKL